MDETTRLIKNHLGYTDEEMQIFQDNPRNMDVLSKTPELMGKTIVIATHDPLFDHLDFETTVIPMVDGKIVK